MHQGCERDEGIQLAFSEENIVENKEKSTLQYNISKRGGLMILKEFDCSKGLCVCNPPAHAVHTPYKGGQCPGILMASLGDNTELLASRKLIQQV